jgi:hypothetical protein
MTEVDTGHWTLDSIQWILRTKFSISAAGTQFYRQGFQGLEHDTDELIFNIAEPNAERIFTIFASFWPTEAMRAWLRRFV